MVRSNLGNIYKTKKAAEGWARGRPVRRVPGGWQIQRGLKKKGASVVARKRKKRSRRSSGRKTYKTKAAAKRAKPKRASVYKVIGGWRISKGRKRKKRRSR